MKPFKSSRKVQVTARLYKWPYTIDTEDEEVYRRNRRHLQKTFEPSVEPIATAPEPDMASAGEKGNYNCSLNPSPQ